MAKTVEFFFDFGSPTSYLAYTQLPKLAADAARQLVWRPMLLGGVFKATGNASPVTVPAKGRWMFQDMARWARRYGVPLAMNPHFPINTLTLMRGAVGLQTASAGRLRALRRHRLPRHVGARPATWATRPCWPTRCSAPASTRLRSLRWSTTPRSRPRWWPTPSEAVARGVFGAPTMFVGEQMFFGQDRLDFVREALA